MDDQLDNDLRNRIREVFDNFEDTSSDEGWLLLREKFPEKAKRRAVAWLWWGSAAAVLLLFLGVLWFKNAVVDDQHLVINKKRISGVETSKHIAQQKVESANDSSATSVKHQTYTNNVQPHNPADKGNEGSSVKKTLLRAASPVQNKDIKKNANNIAQIYHPSPEVISKTPINVLAQNGVAAKSNDHPSNQLALTNQANTLTQNGAAVNSNNAPKVDTITNLSANSLAAVAIPVGINMQDETRKSNKLPFSDDNTKNAKTPEKTRSTNKSVSFAVYAATYFNYAKGSDNQLNLGAGVTSDIKLSKNLKFSTGVAIAQNSLTYNSQVPLTSQLNSPSAIAFASTKDVYSAAAPTLKNYNANLVGLDVPLNLKYEFNPKNSDTYISAGLSSGTFINETYTYSYKYNAPFSANASQVLDQSTRKSFNSFYFAKTLNFSFGTGYALGNNRLVVEPFVKYPLDGLGSQQLKFGAGGVNLKFNFQTKK